MKSLLILVFSLTSTWAFAAENLGEVSVTLKRNIKFSYEYNVGEGETEKRHYSSKLVGFSRCFLVLQTDTEEDREEITYTKGTEFTASVTAYNNIRGGEFASRRITLNDGKGMRYGCLFYEEDADIDDVRNLWTARRGFEITEQE